MTAVMDISSQGVSMLVENEKGEFVHEAREAFPALSYTESDKLTEEGIEKICAKIAHILDECEGLDIDGLYVVATASMRYITNADEVAEVLKKYLGIEVNTMDAETEARCALESAKALGNIAPDAVLIELGGMGTAVGSFSGDEMVCLDFGGINLQKGFVRGIYPDEDEYEAMKRFVKGEIKRSGLSKMCEGVTAAYLAGSITGAISELYKAEYGEEEDPRRADPVKLGKLAKKILTSKKRSATLIKYAPETIYFICSELVLLSQLLKKLQFETVVFSDGNIKDGFLRLLSAGEITAQASSMQVERETKKIETVDELVREIRKRAKNAPFKVKMKNTPQTENPDGGSEE